MSINIDNDYPSTYTKNLNLEKQPQEQFYNVDVVNSNSDKIDEAIGNRTINDTVVADNKTGSLTNLLSKLGNMIKNITGKPNWYTAPSMTLQALSDLIVSTASPNKLLKLDKDGKLPASITGDSATATKLQTARKINGVSFDGTADITVMDDTKAASNHTHNYAGSDTVGGVANSAKVANHLNITNSNEIRLNKNGYNPASIYINRYWSDGTNNPLLTDGYTFFDGSINLANVKAKNFIGNLQGGTVNATTGDFSDVVNVAKMLMVNAVDDGAKIVLHQPGDFALKLELEKKTGTLLIQNKMNNNFTDVKAKTFLGNLQGTATNADTLDEKHASDFAPSGYGLGSCVQDVQKIYNNATMSISDFLKNPITKTGFYQSDFKFNRCD